MKSSTVSMCVGSACLWLLPLAVSCGGPQHSPEPAASAPASPPAEKDEAERFAPPPGAEAAAPSPRAKPAPAPKAAAGSEDDSDLLREQAPKHAGAPRSDSSKSKKKEGQLDLPHDDPSLVANLNEARAEFNEAIELKDCSRAEEFRDALCELAARICELSRSGDALGRRCDDGQQRCEEAKQRYKQSCD